MNYSILQTCKWWKGFGR